MFNKTDTTNCYPLRHPDNNNLSLHYGDSFEGLFLQVDCLC